MSQNSQYSMDSERLAALVERHTDIPRGRVSEFVSEYGVEKMLPCANILCETDGQRKKLTALFEFKNLYETVRHGEANRGYRMDSVESAKDYFRNYFADVRDREHVVAAYLQSDLSVIVTKPISSGTLNQALFIPRDIIKEALFCNAHSIVVAHNHPSGSTDVSQEDINATYRLLDAAGAAGVHLVDHIIVAGDSAVSLADQGHIRQGISKAAAAISEKHGEYARKPLRIKEQLAIAEKQLAIEAAKRQPQKKSYDRGSR